jgi:hypothetical protein
MMKKMITLVAIALFSLSAAAQEAKTVTKEVAKKESCCAAKASNEKAMTASEISKCKAEGKKCDATMAATEEKKCRAKKA